MHLVILDFGTLNRAESSESNVQSHERVIELREELRREMESGRRSGDGSFFASIDSLVAFFVFIQTGWKSGPRPRLGDVGRKREFAIVI
jgi:hypothetical protein